MQRAAAGWNPVNLLKKFFTLITSITNIFIAYILYIIYIIKSIFGFIMKYRAPMLDVRQKKTHRAINVIKIRRGNHNQAQEQVIEKRTKGSHAPDSWGDWTKGSHAPDSWGDWTKGSRAPDSWGDWTKGSRAPDHRGHWTKGSSPP
ncbi:hypothetical protein ABU162_28015 [Paenibacillus thiaminolyticus]|uniref:hypothetical protein n=1 Tax=Paenibacillus thiaminolyticus TaxID=49283 RepID=UPI0035A73A91